MGTTEAEVITECTAFQFEPESTSIEHGCLISMDLILASNAQPE
jgi:hypothetical protein